MTRSENTCGRPLAPVSIVPEQRIPSIGPYLLLCVVLAILVDFGNYHRLHSSDSLVPILNSLYRWAPFFWESNRTGSLLPLVAAPFEHPLVNLLAQSGLGILAGFASFFLLSRYIVRDGSWPIVALLSISAFLFLFTPPSRFSYLSGHQPYGVSCTLSLLGLLLLERWPGRRSAWLRVPVAFLLILLAHWANSSIGFVVGPLVLARALFLRQPNDAAAEMGLPVGRRSRLECWKHALGTGATSETAIAVLFLGAATTILYVVMCCCPYQETHMGILPFKDWPMVWRWMALSLRQNFAPIGLLVVPALFGICFSRMGAFRTLKVKALRRATALLAAGTLNLLFMCSLTWVALNRATPIWRYVMLPIVFAQTAFVILAISPFAAKLSAQNRRRFSNACVAFVFAGVLSAFGTPSLRGVHADLDNTLGKWTPEILDSQATHICGDYWQVWSSVYHANLTLYERGQNKVIWGVSYRAAPTKDLWTVIPQHQRRLAVLQPEKEPMTTFLCLAPLIGCPGAARIEQRENLSIYCAPVMLCEFGPGFYDLEGKFEANMRWSQRQSRLKITNTSTSPKLVVMSAEVRTGHSESAHLRIAGPWIEKRIDVNHQAGSFRCVFTMPPGTQEINFECDAAAKIVPSDSRRLVFHLVNFSVNENVSETADTSSLIER